MPYLLELSDLPAGIDLCRRLSLSFLELNSNFPDSAVSALDPALLIKTREEYGLSFTLHLDDSMSIADTNPYVREAYLKTSLEAIDFCKTVDIPTINIHFSKGNIVTLPDGPHYIFDHYREEFHANLISYRKAVEEAIGTSPIKVAIENTNGWDAHELIGIDLLLESPVFGLTLDIGHDHAVKNKDLPYFESHKDRLCHMHAHDGWDKTNHQTLGSGEIPLHDRLKMAREAGARVVLETKTIRALEDSVTWLKKEGWM